jgi:hypothetical protein
MLKQLNLTLVSVPLSATLHDRVLQGLSPPLSELYLRPGKYNLTIDDEKDKQIFAQSITVAERQDPAEEP